jgi:uncharacterized protein (TIGR03083 family)
MVGDSTRGTLRRPIRRANADSAVPSSASTAPAPTISPIAASGATTTSTNEMAGHHRSARTGVGIDHSRISDGMGSSYPITRGSNPGDACRLGFPVVDHAAAFVEENRLLAALAATADLDTPVPTCPGWSLGQLFRHVGRGDRWAATIVRTGQPADPREVADGKPPENGLVEWLRGGPVAVLDAVAEVGAERPVWTFTGAKPASWWIPRRLGEAMVHRADAALAMGQDYAVDIEHAAEGVSEWLDLVAARKAEEIDAPLADGATLHLHATDEGLGEAGEWLVRGIGGDVTWERGHGKGDVAVRGPAGDLLLAVMRRRPAESVETIGDTAVWERWLAATGF